MTATDDAARTARLERAAAGGGILANQILGARYALPLLRRRYELTVRMVNRLESGAITTDTVVSYVNAIAPLVGELASQITYNHPDTGRYAQQSVYNAYRHAGLPGVLRVIENIGKRAAAMAA